MTSAYYKSMMESFGFKVDDNVYEYDLIKTADQLSNNAENGDLTNDQYLDQINQINQNIMNAMPGQINQLNIMNGQELINETISDAWRIILGMIETAVFTIGTPGSLIIFAYFLTKSKSDKSASTFLNMCISFTDMVICTLTIFSAISDFSYGKVDPFANDYFCNISGFLWNLSSVMSISLIAVLSVARTVSVKFPFTKVRRLHVAIPVGIYFGITLLESTMPYLHGKTYEHGIAGYVSPFPYCPTGLRKLFPQFSVERKLMEWWVVYMDTLVPFPLIVISCCFTAWLLRAGNSEVRNEEGEKIKREATLTIVILTVIYIVCNTPRCVYWTVMMNPNMHSENFVLTGRLIPHTFVGLNSMCNVITYFCRIKGLQQFVMGGFTNVKTVVCCHHETGQAAVRPVTRVTSI